MDEHQYLVALYSHIPFGPARTKLLVDYFASAEKAWKASRKKLLEIGLRPNLVNGFLDYREKFDPKKYFERLKKLLIDYITINDRNYPENLVDLENAPPVLYIKGKISVNDSNAVAVVGSRKMTSYGRTVTQAFTSELASFGITIVSGLARGVDTVAHKTALEVGGQTIAVLACGLDLVYPFENTLLAEKISKNGAILSEYPLGYPPLKGNFVNRNRIISGLSKAVIVVQGEKKSGTLLTASHAAAQGRPLFAVPGEITSPLSGAPHFLIQCGAKMATSVKDILEELDLPLKEEE